MATLLFAPPSDFILSEAPDKGSRSEVTLTQTGVALPSGTVLSRQETGSAGFAVDAGSVGNPTSGAVTVGKTAMNGVYRIIFQSATTFTVEDPDGALVDNGVLGTPFTGGGVTFTLTAGGTAAAANDTAKVTVAMNAGKWVQYASGGADGKAAGLLYNALPVATGPVRVVVLDRDMEANRFSLTGLDAKAEADLLKLGIKVRGKTGMIRIATPAL